MKHSSSALAARLLLVAAMLALTSAQVAAAQGQVLSRPLAVPSLRRAPRDEGAQAGALASSHAQALSLLLRPAAPTAASWAVTLVCPDFVDLRWDPHFFDTFQVGGEECQATIRRLMRGPPCGMDEVAALCSLSSTDDSYRDTSVVAGEQYCYAIYVSYDCPRQNVTQPVFTYLGPTTDPAVTVTESCVGAIYEDETFAGGVLVNPSLAVREGATLTLSGVTVQGGQISSAGHGDSNDPPGGVIQIGGSRLENACVYFAGAGRNFLDNSTIVGQTDWTEVRVHYDADVSITGNTLTTAYIGISGSPRAFIYDNEFHDVGISMIRLGDVPQDAITICNNWFFAPSHIHQYGGSVRITDNTFQGVEPRTGHAIRVSGWDGRPGGAAILDNRFIGYGDGISLLEGAVATVRGNLVLYSSRGKGMFVRYNAQATVEENTFMYNRTALEFWEEPVAMLRHNCIAGNTEIGAATVFEGPGIQVDARENWWGHASGPEHPSNPGGRGDRATGQLQVADHLVMDNCFLDLATDLIGPGGGSASTSSGNTSLAVPAGALSSDTRIALRPMGLSSLATMPAPLANGAGLRLFQVAGSRASDGAPVSELGAEAELTVAYSEAERLGIDEDTLAIYRLDTGQQAASGTAAGDTRVSVTGALDGASWTLLTGELDPDGNVLTAHTSSLGTFVVIGEREEVHICLPLVATRVW